MPHTRCSDPCTFPASRELFSRRLRNRTSPALQRPTPVAALAQAWLTENRLASRSMKQIVLATPRLAAERRDCRHGKHGGSAKHTESVEEIHPCKSIRHQK